MDKLQIYTKDFPKDEYIIDKWLKNYIDGAYHWKS